MGEILSKESAMTDEEAMSVFAFCRPPHDKSINAAKTESIDFDGIIASLGPLFLNLYVKYFL